MTMLLLATALAHHNKGLPHYGYFENYPQVPTEEYIRVEGRWEVGATVFNFQGLGDRESSDTPNDVKIFAYIYDLEKDVGYEGPATIAIVSEGETVSVFERLEPDGEGVYVSRETLPHSGDYSLEFTFDEGEATLPFNVDLAADRVNWALLGGLGLAVLTAMSLALAGRKKRLARRAAAPATSGA
jgi:hypothetical protein